MQTGGGGGSQGPFFGAHQSHNLIFLDISRASPAKAQVSKLRLGNRDGRTGLQKGGAAASSSLDGRRRRRAAATAAARSVCIATPRLSTPSFNYPGRSCDSKEILSANTHLPAGGGSLRHCHVGQQYTTTTNGEEGAAAEGEGRCQSGGQELRTIHSDCRLKCSGEDEGYVSCSPPPLPNAAPLPPLVQQAGHARAAGRAQAQAGSGTRSWRPPVPCRASRRRPEQPCPPSLLCVVRPGKEPRGRVAQVVLLGKGAHLAAAGGGGGVGGRGLSAAGRGQRHADASVVCQTSTARCGLHPKTPPPLALSIPGGSLGRSRCPQAIPR